MHTGPSPLILLNAWDAARFNRHDWDGVCDLIAVDARARLRI
jgi:hypothetical protein